MASPSTSPAPGWMRVDAYGYLMESVLLIPKPPAFPWSRAPTRWSDLPGSFEMLSTDCMKGRRKDNVIVK